MNKPPTVAAGALVGALLTTALTALLYLAHHLAGLPFAPFQVFDWTARALPGAVITFGIDTMVALIRGLSIGATADVAKAAEQTMAVVGLLLTGTLAGAIAFGLLRRQARVPARPGAGARLSLTPGMIAGLIAGAVIGAAVAVVVATSARPGAAGPVLGALWTFVAFLCWGATLGWSWNRLAGLPAPALASAASVGAPAPAPAAEEPALSSAAGAGDAGLGGGATSDAGLGGGARSGPKAVIVEPVDRRTFMIRLGGATAVITVAGAALGGLLARGRRGAPPAGERWSGSNALPNAGAAVGPARGTRPEFTPLDEHYRIDINTVSPSVDEAEWRLRIGGLVERPTGLTLDQIRQRYEPMHQFITLACISNPIAGDLISTTRWTGATLRSVMEDVGLRPDATHVRIRSADDFDEVLDLSLAMRDPRVMLAYAWDGVPLTREHGFPLRIYIPDHYGMKQPKWIESVEAIAEWQPGYWVRRGWDREARMRATSVIDTVAADMMVIGADAQPMHVPIGGIAHAGTRGISRVEVSIDDGEWRPALLREPLSPTTWVLWRYDWPFEPGRHTFGVRCFEADGTPQIARESPVRPSGATGLHRVDRMI